MEVFVTGGTGVLGRPVVRRLVAAGHRVRVAARSPENERLIRTLGAVPVQTELFAPASVRRAIEGAQAVLHLATHIPSAGQMGKAASWAANDRLRTEGTRHVIDGAIAAGVEVVVYPSVTLLYADGGAAWLSEDAAIAPSAPTRTSLSAEEDLRRFTAAGRRGIVLRMGNFYGPEAGHTQEMLAYARMGVAPIVGAAEAYASYVWVDDAAAAAVAALERAPAGTYNVVDDAPATRGALIAAMARAAGRRSLWRMPAFLARMMMGAALVELQSRSQRVSNQTFKAVTGWAPEVSSPEVGFGRLASGEPVPAGT